MKGNSGSHNAHSCLGPSGASRWTVCQASVPFCRENGWEGQSSDASILGTRAHDIAEAILTGKLDKPPEGFEHVAEYTNLCATYFNRWGGTQMIELKTPLFYKKDETGTMDYFQISTTRIIAGDYKNGFMPVTAERNKQLASYVYSTLVDLDPIFGFSDDLTIEMFISQPRCMDPDSGGVWIVTFRELREFCKVEIDVPAQRILAAMQPGKNWRELLDFNPSYDTCFFCPAKQNSQCAKMVTEALQPIFPEQDVLAVFDAIDDQPIIPMAEFMSDQQLLQIFRFADEISAVVKGVRETAMRRAAEGNPIPGTKVVAGRQGNRQWADDQEAALFLATAGLKQDQVFDLKVKSPAQAEKILKADPMTKPMAAGLATLTVRSPGKPHVCLSEDSRPALADAAEVFAAIEIESDE